ncbi:MAG: T9SS type A sorting domain-containing protein [Ignavibacteria bacterium]|nr:T9SS type A sorting domain-containing protein [Ignavibacteria bacterium]
MNFFVSLCLRGKVDVFDRAGTFFGNTVRTSLLMLGFLAATGSVARAQEIVPMENGSRGVCASPTVNDPRVIQEAWTNTQMQHPGIVEAMRQWNLQKGVAELKVADQNLFWVYNIDKKVFDTLRAELKAIGSISYVWVALGEWSNGHVTANEVDAVENALEHSTSRSSLDSTKGILQIDRQAYGDPPNINASFQKGRGDGRTHFLICDIQDGWTGTGGYVAGFFYSVDVDPNTGAVKTSNTRDMLYIDSYPGIFFNGVHRTSVALATLSHEFQHLIHWNYDPNEITFFNEGLSEYAEYLCGFQLRSPAGYFSNTNVLLTGWNSTLDDYSRAALWTRYLADQFGLPFIRSFVQNPNNGIPGFEQSLSQSGITKTFTATATNFFTANWLGSNAPDSTYRYRSALAARPTLKGDYTDPNVQRTDTLMQQGAQYISFASAKNFRITFTLPFGVSVRAIESGPLSVRIRDVAGGVEFTSPELGTQFTSVVFVVAALQTGLATTYSCTASGELLRFLAEESYDSGTPHPFSQGIAPYIGFGNNATTLGMAVRFQPQVKGNVLRKARMMVAFNQEFSNGTALPTDSKNFVFHVWDDRNGRPGADIIQPFRVSVNRDTYPFGSFVDVDLSAYESALTNLKGPVYLGFMEDVIDSVGTYLAVDNFVQGDYSYVYRGPNYTRAPPNAWQTMREVSAIQQTPGSLDGFNLMIRAVFEYADSTIPSLAIGYLQNPLLSEYIDVIAASSDELRNGSLSGTISQTGGSLPLRFYGVPGSTRVFIDSTQQLKGNGTVALRVRGAKKYGIVFADTTVTFNARLLKPDGPETISTPSSALTVFFDAGAVGTPTYVTASDGTNDPLIPVAPAQSSSRIFSLGPSGLVLNRPSTVRISGVTLNETTTLAQFRNGKWLAVPSTVDMERGELNATISRLGVLGVVKKSDVDGQVDVIPTQFALYQNYPNPFNPSTTIEFDLAYPSSVKLIVYDVLGKEIVRVVDDVRSAGHYALRLDASPMPSGVYFYRLSAGGFSHVRKLVVLK